MNIANGEWSFGGHYVGRGHHGEEIDRKCLTTVSWLGCVDCVWSTMREVRYRHWHSCSALMDDG